MTVAGLPMPFLTALSGTRVEIDQKAAGIVARARAGDRDAFGELLEAHLPAARRLALAAVGRPADADEAVQEASIAAWTHLGTLSTDAAFRPWFLRIVWRKALDRRRSLRAWMVRFVAGEDDDGRAVHEARSLGPGPEAAAVDAAMAAAASRVIGALPRRLRDPFLLVSSGDQRYEDIAALLGIPVGTVKWRVSEARRLVRAKLERLGWGTAP